MKRTIILSSILGLFIVLVIFINIFLSNRRNKEILTTTTTLTTTTMSYILVEIKGEVKYPGIYRFTNDDLYVFDCIEMAGGLLDSANTDDINMLSKVTSGTRIFISSNKENKSYVIRSDGVDISTLVNINTATIEELKTIPSIGDAKAQNIIDYRKANGLFKSIEEIKNVPGIGDSIYEKIKGYITI